MTNRERAVKIAQAWSGTHSSKLMMSDEIERAIDAACAEAVAAEREACLAEANKEAKRSSEQAERSERNVHGWRCRVVGAQAVGDAIRARGAK